MNPIRARDLHRLRVRLGLSLALVVASGWGVWGVLAQTLPPDDLHRPQAEHADQADFVALVLSGRVHEAFEEAFEAGDELFETTFNSLDGVGANVGQGQRFTRVPRADLNGLGEWANHVPSRATGPNAESCNACHRLPADDGAGPVVGNAHRDPEHSGILSAFIARNTTPVFGAGALQRLAEEMTEELHAIRDQAASASCATGKKVTRPLLAKGVNFGQISAIPEPGMPCAASLDTSKVRGVSADLVVRPFQWKGSVPFLREFARGASHNELGMQAVELAGDGLDGDFDGVADELTVGDITALAVYMAAQPRPTTRTELASLGLIPPLVPEETLAVERGLEAFDRAGCASCHAPSLAIDVPVFSEPSRNPNYRDGFFPAGQDPVARGVGPAFAITFDLTRDLPDNVIEDDFGNVVFRLGSFPTDSGGRAVVELFGDLKRHDMGPSLAEPIDEVGTGASTFMTENLWGVGSTAPYLHDGRATTLAEAILLHGGESEQARDAFAFMTTSEQKDLIAFLEDMVLFKLEE